MIRIKAGIVAFGVAASLAIMAGGPVYRVSSEPQISCRRDHVTCWRYPKPPARGSWGGLL